MIARALEACAVGSRWQSGGKLGQMGRVRKISLEVKRTFYLKKGKKRNKTKNCEKRGREGSHAQSEDPQIVVTPLLVLVFTCLSQDGNFGLLLDDELHVTANVPEKLHKEVQLYNG